MGEPGGLQSMGSLRVGCDWATSLSPFTFMQWRRWQPTPVFLPGESQGWHSLVGCCLWGRRVGHDWSDLAAAAAPAIRPPQKLSPPKLPLPEILPVTRSCPRFWVTSLSFWLLFPVLSPCSYFLTWMLLKVPFSFSLSSLPSPTGMYVPTSTIPTLCERLLIFLFSTSSAFHNSRGTSLRVFQEEYSFSHLLPSSQSTPGTQLSVQHMFCE